MNNWKWVLIICLISISRVESQNTLPYFEAFNTLDRWERITPNAGVGLETQGSNTYLKFNDGAGADEIFPDLETRFSPLSPNVATFQVNVGGISPTGSLSNFWKVGIGWRLGERGSSSVPFKIFANGTMTGGDNGPCGVTLAANTWYEIRIVMAQWPNSPKPNIYPPGQESMAQELACDFTTNHNLDLMYMFYEKGGSSNPFIARVDNISMRNEFTLSDISSNGHIDFSPPPNHFGKYVQGQQVTLTPVPDAGYNFHEWNAGIQGNANPVTITVNNNMNVGAAFVLNAPNTLFVENLNNNSSTTPYPIVNGGIIYLNSTVPPEKGFVTWKVISGPGSVHLVDPTSPNSAVQLTGGNATIRAVFEDPKVRVWVRDDASGQDFGIKPVIKIQNSSATAPLVDFEMEFFFNTECLKVAHKNNPPLGPWSLDWIEGDGGRYKVVFKYVGTLSPGEVATTPVDLILSYAPCPDCGKWKKTNDWSLHGAGLNFKELRANKDHILVYKDPWAPGAVAIFGVTPSMDFETRPGEPPGSVGNSFIVPVTLPDFHDVQIPNVAESQSFLQGNLVSNGSFELGSRGWAAFPQDGDAQFEIRSHGPLPSAPAYDGFRYASVLPIATGLNGIAFNIKEADPAYENIIRGFPNTGLRGVTLSAWVRSESDVSSATVRLGYFPLIGDPILSPPVQVQGSWKLLTFTTVVSSPYGGPYGENVIRFGIVSDGGVVPFLVDGVNLVPGNSYVPPVVAQTWFNTRNAKMQTRKSIPGEFDSMTPFDPAASLAVFSNTEFDALGRVGKTFLPYAKSCPSGSCNPYFDLAKYADEADAANFAYAAGNPEGLPDAANFAFTQPLYEQDQLTSVIKSGKPGINYQAQDPALTVDGADHTVRTHHSGVDGLSEAALGNDLSKPVNKNNPVYGFTHTVSPDQNESMEWKNGFGQVEKATSVLVEGGVKKFIVTENIYDERGNLKRVLPPISCKLRNGLPSNLPKCVEPTDYNYDAENRLIEEIHPDAGTTRYFYDLLGNLRFSQSEVQRNGTVEKFTASVYDNLGRVKYSGEYKDIAGEFTTVESLQIKAKADLAWPDEDEVNFDRTAKYFYDEMPPAIPPEFEAYNATLGKNVRLYPPSMGSFTHTQGKLCAVIRYHPPVDVMDATTTDLVEEFTTKAFRYDKYGRVTNTFVYNGFITNGSNKLQITHYFYNTAGKLNEVWHSEGDGVDPMRIEKLAYNSIGNLKSISNEEGKILAEYSYYPSTGQVNTIVLDKEEHPISIRYNYDINGGIKHIFASRAMPGGPETVYNEFLFYDILPFGSTASPKFNGSVAQLQYQMNPLSDPSLVNQRDIEYTYDDLNRLLEAAYFQVDPMGARVGNDLFSESIRYENDGRIRSLRRGVNVNNTSGGEYEYKPATNRLANVTAGMDAESNRDMTARLSGPNFDFDANGRLADDLSKNLKVRYDFSDRPLEFSYTQGAQRIREVMRYDEAGSRVSKMRFVGGALADQFLIADGDASRERDYRTLAGAVDALEAKYASLPTPLEALRVHAIPDKDGFVDLTGIDEVTAIPTQAGQANLELLGLRENSPEYLALLEDRAEGFTLDRSSHYSGTGNETREAVGTTPGVLEAKVYTDLPEGIGRYNPGSSDPLYYVKNRLGSTVFSALSGAGQATEDAYEYFPFGKEKRMFISSQDKVTPTFTGKELDDGIELSYFGARYYDADLGVWTSPDPVRQYHSPYAYCGSNVASCVDPDGNEGIGFSSGWDAKVGAGLSGYGVKNERGWGGFLGEGGRASIGKFELSTGFAGPGKNKYAVGASGGAAVSAFVTSADNIEGFAAIPKVLSLELGFIMDFSIQFAYGNGDWALGISGGPGGGAAISSFDTGPTKGTTVWDSGPVSPEAQNAPLDFWMF